MLLTELQALTDDLGIVASTAPVRIPPDERAGILSRVCIPVRHHGLLIGYLWLIDDQQRLGENELAFAVEAAPLADNLVGHLLSPSDELRSGLGLGGRVVLGVGDPQARSSGAYASYRQARMASSAAQAISDLCGIGIWARLAGRYPCVDKASWRESA